MLLGYSIYSLSSASASPVASVQEKGLAILDRVVCLDLTKYAVTAKVHEATIPALYLSVATQENVVYDLCLEKGQIKGALHFYGWENAVSTCARM